MSRKIKEILEDVAAGRVEVSDAYESLRDLPCSQAGDARLDLHRELRLGIPEIIWGENKSVAQLKPIIERLFEKKMPIIISRLQPEKFSEIRPFFRQGVYHAVPRMLTWSPNEPEKKGKGRIAVLAAGTSDVPVAEEACVVLKELGHDIERVFDVGVSGLHRLLSEVPRIREATVLIVVAGMEGALPSVVAGLVGKPIIAVPTSVGYGTGLGGVSALMTMLNGCAPGVSVVNIDNGVGAAVSAHFMNTI